MLLDLSELLSGNCKTRTFKAKVEMERFVSASGEYDIIDKSETEITVSATGNRKFLVTGEDRVVLLIPCARCLEAVKTPVDYVIERELDFNNEDEQSDERLEEMSYIDGYHLDVDKLVYSEILINIPLRVLCSKDCKGLCIKCGANLNKGECGCDREQLDPRMSVIQDIFKNFKEV
ncbi:MAG: DUF177 domain-containing protein [Thermoflexaceae bacterium]|nr:DUF177 domain-containing protein [Thermoflexaceae bacterium]